MAGSKKRRKAPKKPRARASKRKAGKTAAQAEAHFVEGLLTRGEAVPRKSAGQKLPPGATHWVVGEEKGGKTTVKRGRFSLV